MSEKDLTHRQERQHEKDEHRHSTPGMSLSSIHPGWFVGLAVIACGAAVLIWTFVVW